MVNSNHIYFSDGVLIVFIKNLPQTPNPRLESIDENVNGRRRPKLMMFTISS